MLRRRLLDALDSPAPLVFVEAAHGGGKRTLLTQWADHGRGRHGEIRLLLDAERFPSQRSQLLRLFWSMLQRRRELSLPAPPADEGELETSLMRHLREIRRPISVATLGADSIPLATFRAALHLLDVGVRLIVAGFDLSGLMDAARTRGVYYSVLGDRDVALTLEETRRAMVVEGLTPTQEAVSAMYRATLGHPGMIAACLATMPVESAAGMLSRDRAVGAFFTNVPLGQWPTALAGFLTATVQLPRFTAREAALLTDTEDATRAMERLRILSLGRMAWHPGLQERVFRWDEPVRQVIRQSLTQPPGDEAEVLSRVIAAARASHDDELLISILVLAGDLEQAETLLREKIWDVLPNAMAPLWAPLERISPLTLVDHPALLAARLRLSPHPSRSPASARAAQLAGAAVAEAADAASPWSRVGDLACAIEFALYAGQRERLADLFARVRALSAELVASEASMAAGGREVSHLLLLADAVFRSGNTIPAAEIGRLAAQLVEVDPERLDPRGERLAFARRLILHDHRARGLEDPVDPESLLAGAQFLWRDGDIVVAAMALMWGDIDDGDFGAADARLRIAADRVADPEAWPILMLLRAHLAMIRQSPGELEAYVSAYERGTLSEPGPFAQQSLSQMGRITDYLSKKVGRPVPSPGYLPATPEPGRLFYPRVEFVVRLMEALYAVRADRPAAVRTALAHAVALSPRRELGLYTLANATREEITALQEAAEDVPGASRLHLESALLFAGALHSPSVDLSDREAEVLDHLREGATNPEMARAMFVSVNTVKFHRANLMRKLEATNRDELLRAADTLGL